MKYSRIITGLICMLVLALMNTTDVMANDDLITKVSVTNSNESADYIKNGDDLTFVLMTTVPVTIEKMIINDIEMSIVVDSISEAENGISFKVQIPDEGFIDQEKIEYEVTVKSKSSDQIQVYRQTEEITYLSPIQISNIESSSDQSDPLVVTSSSIVEFSFTTNHKVQITNKVNIGNDEFEMSEVEDEVDYKEYRGIAQIDGTMYKDGEIVVVDPTQLIISDRAGNKAQLVTLEEGLHYQENNPFKTGIGKILSVFKTSLFENTESPNEYQEMTNSDSGNSDKTLIIESLSFSSNGENQQMIINGQSLEIEIKTNEKANITDAMINGKSIVMVTEDYLTFKGICPIEENAYDDQARMTFNLTVSNSDTTIIISESTVEPVIYYAPLLIEDVQMTTKTNSNYVKEDDKVNLSFSTNHDIETQVVKINEEVVGLKDNNQGYSYESAIDNELKDNTLVTYSIYLKDVAGNEIIIDTKESSIRYYAQIEPISIEFQSTNDNPYIVKDEGELILLIKTTHPVVITEAQIGNEAVQFESTDQLIYKAIYRLPAGEYIDQQSIIAKCLINDLAGNETYKVNEASIVYYAPISISNLSMISNNCRNGNQFICDNDTVSITFKSNHTVNVQAIVNGNEEPVEMDENNRYKIKRLVDNEMEDQSALEFSLVISDEAGNEVMELSEDDVPNVLIYYSPLILQTTVSSSNKNEQYAKAEDSIKLIIKANRSVHVLEQSIADREAVIEMDNNTTVETSQVMRNNDEEGLVVVKCIVEDKAGNQSEVDMISDITFDKTAPEIRVEPNLDVDTISLNLLINENNLDPGSVKIKGVVKDNCLEQTNDGYKLNVALSDIKNQKIVVNCSDMAGNEASELEQTIEIERENSRNCIKLKAANSQINVCTAGYTISNNIELLIDDWNNIDCILTDKTNNVISKKWNIDEPIMDEGLKNILIRIRNPLTNVMNELDYEIYIDNTPPSINVQCLESKLLLRTDEITSLNINSILIVSLDNQWLGNQKNDKFTKLIVTDKSCNLVQDLLSETNIQIEYDIKFYEPGTYDLIAEAIDENGNTVKEIYTLTVVEAEK